MTALPRRLVIGHLTYTVARDQGAIDRKSLEQGGELAGYSWDCDQSILLAEKLGPDTEAETLLHEVLHQCLATAGVRLDEDAAAGVKELEERAVRSMAGALLATLRRNPKLVAYLVGDSPAKRRKGAATRRKEGDTDGRSRPRTEGPEPSSTPQQGHDPADGPGVPPG